MNLTREYIEDVIGSKRLLAAIMFPKIEKIIMDVHHLVEFPSHNLERDITGRVSTVKHLKIDGRRTGWNWCEFGNLLKVSGCPQLEIIELSETTTIEDPDNSIPAIISESLDSCKDTLRKLAITPIFYHMEMLFGWDEFQETWIGDMSAFSKLEYLELPSQILLGHREWGEIDLSLILPPTLVELFVHHECGWLEWDYLFPRLIDILKFPSERSLKKLRFRFRQGAHVTVAERAPAFRDGGQTIDVRGAGLLSCSAWAWRNRFGRIQLTNKASRPLTATTGQKLSSA